VRVEVDDAEGETFVAVPVGLVSLPAGLEPFVVVVAAGELVMIC
jgi:hypothetical protein